LIVLVHIMKCWIDQESGYEKLAYFVTPHVNVSIIVTPQSIKKNLTHICVFCIFHIQKLVRSN